MKAAIHTRYGPPDVLAVKEIETPVPGDDEILVKVYAATVNRTDCGILMAKPFVIRFFTGLFSPNHPVSGTDFAGVVEATGKNITSFKIGDRVFGFDNNGLNSHAQYLTITESKAVEVIPDNITFEEAAASLEGAHYAFNFINKVNLQQDHKVLVNGATGAIGSAAVQLLKYSGVSVTAVCSTKNVELVRSLGANRVIDYMKDDFTRDQEKYHFVFDAVGKSTFSKCKPLLLNGGVYISSELGPMAQNLFFALMRPVMRNKKVVFPVPTNIRRSVELVKKLLEESRFKPVIDRKYPLNDIAGAFEYVLSGEKTGNVLIIP